MIIDISGLEIFKEIKPVDFNTKGFPQYSANDKANVAVAKRFEKDDKGEFKNHNRLAESFENECALRVSKEYMVQRMMTHLREDLYRARKKRNDFDTYPIPLKLIILDFYYNKGSFYNQPGLPQALDAKDAKLFQEKMVRNMEDRDKWTKEQFNLIPRNFWNAY